MLNEDFKEFAALLNSNRVEYLIVGGYALAAYGHPRYTGDLDFWVGTDPANVEQVPGRFLTRWTSLVSGRWASGCKT